MKKTWGLLAALAILLTGCAAPESTGSETETVESAEATAEITAAPIEAESVEATAEAGPGTIGVPEDDERFLTPVKEKWRGTPPADEQLLSAAKYACDQYQLGTAYDDIDAVGGETDESGQNSVLVAVYAAKAYCPEFDPEDL